VQVWSHEGVPTRFKWQGATHQIRGIHDCWRVHTRWWDPVDRRIWREYIKVTTHTGLLCLLYQDLNAKDRTTSATSAASAAWFLARIYD
jgi:hypothetical protein